jgi:hypothetical protein
MEHRVRFQQKDLSTRRDRAFRGRASGPQSKAKLSATKPLKHPKYEIFARQRALNQSPLVAGQIAGLNYDRRNLFRIENKTVVAARIAWLSRQDEEELREKRKRLEELLWVGLYADRVDFYETVETPIIDRNGHAVLKRNGEPHTKTVIQFKPLD